MKSMIASLLVLFYSGNASAAPQKITCSYQWKNTDAAPNEFSFEVEALGTKKAKVIVSANEDGDLVKVISGIKKSGHEADVTLNEVGIENPAEVFASAKGDIKIQIGDGVSTEIVIQIYENSKYKSGFMTLHCDESYCGKFDFYSVLSCQ